MTNYELITSMTVEELAIALSYPMDVDGLFNRPDNCSKRSCIECKKEWLNSKTEEGTTKSTVYDSIYKAAMYAFHSKNIYLLYEAYGKAKMARDVNLITKEQFTKLNEIIVRNGINS